MTVADINTKAKWRALRDFHDQRFFVYKYGKFVKSFDTWEEANSWIIATDECEL